MKKAYLIVALLLGGAAWVAADDQPQAKGPPPVVATAWLAEGKLQIVREVTVTKFVPVQKTKEVVINGVKMTAVVTEMVPVTVIEKQTVAGDGFEVFDLAGQKVPQDKLAELLKKETQALMSADGKPIDPSYLKGAKEGTLILVPVKKPGPAPEKP